MRATDILSQQTLDEVSMTPTDYAADIESAGPRGVLVGFEFEVCIPQSFRTGVADGDEVNPQKIANLFKHNIMDIFDVTWSTTDVKRFDDVFRPKPEVAKYPSLKDTILNYQHTIVPKIKRIWENDIPPQTRVKIMKRISASGLDYKSYAEKRYSESRIESLIPELQFVAAAMLAAWLGNVMQVRGNWYYQIQNMLEDTWNGHIQLKRLAGADSVRVGNNFNKYFEYDPQQAMEYLELYGYGTIEDDDYYDVDAEYRAGADRLAPLLKSKFGMPVTVFDNYHERDKQRGRWYIEPDGSLEPDEDDSSAEIVTPPYPAPQAVGVLRDFFTLAKENGFYTGAENRTGLHINISIPKHVDVLKLALFVGDLHVLRKFGREFNHYAESVYRSLDVGLQDPTDRRVRELQDTPEMTDKIKVIDTIAKGISSDHTASVSDNGKYISFRHVGGDYLRDYSAIHDVLGRFIRAMLIANDPNAHREEYLKKLSKFVTVGSETSTSDPVAQYRNMLMRIRSEGLPALECRAFIWNARLRNPGEQALASLLGKPIQGVFRFMHSDPSDSTKNIMLRAVQDSARNFGRSLENTQKKIASTNNGFYVGTWAPQNMDQIKMLDRWTPPRGVQSVSGSGISNGYTIGKKVMLSPTTPLARAAIRQILNDMKQQLTTKRRPRSRR